MRLINEVTQVANFQEKYKVRIDRCNITYKRKTYSEVDNEKETKKQYEKVLDP